MKNIVFLNFDYFTKEKTIFFNNVNKILNKDQFKLIILSSTDIKSKKFDFYKLDYKKYYIQSDLKKIKKILNFTKQKEREWQSTLQLYYKDKDLEFIKNKINSIIYNFLCFLDKHKPTLAIIWTEYHPISAIFMSMCNYFNINYLIAERGILNETIVIEKNGLGGKSYITPKKILNNSKTNHYNKFIKINKKLKGKWTHKIKEYSNKNNILNKKKTIFFAGTNEIWQGFYPYKNKKTSPLYKSHFELLKELSKISKKFENLEVIFKPHPKDRIFKKYKNFIPKNITIYNDIDAIDLIKKSDLFITISSSLISDAMFYNKLSLIVGNFEISNKNICYEVKKKHDLFRFIKLFYENKLPKKNYKNWKIFINFILNNYLYNVSKYSFGKLKEADFVENLLNNIKLNINNKKYDKIKKELIKIKYKIFFKDLIKDSIKKLINYENNLK